MTGVSKTVACLRLFYLRMHSLMRACTHTFKYTHTHSHNNNNNNNNKNNKCL
jgi:hypothetical protein